MSKAGLEIFFESYWGENSVVMAYVRLGMFRKKRVVSLKKNLRFGSVKSMLNQTVELEYCGEYEGDTLTT